MAVRSPRNILVGIDWATQAHEICVLDASGRVLGKKSFPNTPEGLEQLVRWLLTLTGGDVTKIAVAIERPDGLVVEALLDYQIEVYSLNPKQLDRFRDRFSVAGAKDDQRDARVLADALRTDRHAFRRVLPLPHEVVVLRGLAREDDALRNEVAALSNRMENYLGRYYPQILTLAADRADPFLWELWELAPTPEAGAKLSTAVLESLLHRHRITRLDARDVTQALRTRAPRVAAATSEASVQVLSRLVPRLRLAYEQRKQCAQHMETQLDAVAARCEGESTQHSDATIVRSLPGVGTIVAARMLSEGAEAIRQRDLNRLRALGGSAPVTQRSGKSCHAIMRRACSGWLRFAYYHWARTAMQQDEYTRRHYAALRARGKSHGRALRGVVDRLLNVAVAMLRKGTLYDPSLRCAGRSKQSKPTTAAGKGSQPKAALSTVPYRITY
jgi:transposase